MLGVFGLSLQFYGLIDLMNLGSFAGVRVVNEAFLEAIMMNLGKIEGERGSKQGANKEF